MVRTKLTAKGWPRTSRIVAWLTNRRQRRKLRKPFKIELTLREQKTVNIKKGGNVIKTISLRRESKFSPTKTPEIFN